MISTKPKSLAVIANPVLDTERERENGSLKPEARERVMMEIAQYLDQTGVVNYNRIAKLWGINRRTAGKIVSEILDGWRDDESDQLTLQIHYIENKISEIEQFPERYDLKTEREKYEYLMNQFDRLNRLRTLQFNLRTLSGGNSNDAAEVSIFRNIRSRTRQMLIKKYGGVR